jgi:aminopeptidase N
MNNPVKLLALATASALTLALTVTSASFARQAPPSPGAPSAGDPYYPRDGNGGYDVGHYHLGIRYHPRTDVLAGRATIRARATQRLSRFNLDFVGLRVRSIRVNGEPAAWSRTRHELTVVPRQRLRRDGSFTVRVRYGGIPRLTANPFATMGFRATDDGFIIAGQPHVAANWFPVNDHPSDKASYTFRVTVPTGLEVVANGDFVGRRPHDRWTTWIWDSPDPMASYLATVDVGEFRIHDYRRGGIRYYDAIDPDLFERSGQGPSMGRVAARSLARQPEIIGFLAGVAGPYPWRSAGGIVDDADLGFALETQTRSIYSKFFFSNPVGADFVVVHELAHQWYGDSLAVERWRDIWLNEGFATYTEWLWSEREGLGTAQEIFDFFISDDFAPADDPFWQLIIGDPGPEDLFADPVYVRGAMTLHRLRLRVGDEEFFRILREWAQSRAGDNVTTREFRGLAHRISGERLHGLFQSWLFTPGRPDSPSSASGRPDGSPRQEMPPGAAATLSIANREGSLKH